MCWIVHEIPKGCLDKDPAAVFKREIVFISLQNEIDCFGVLNSQIVSVGQKCQHLFSGGWLTDPVHLAGLDHFLVEGFKNLGRIEGVTIVKVVERDTGWMAQQQTVTYVAEHAGIVLCQPEYSQQQENYRVQTTLSPSGAVKGVGHQFQGECGHENRHNRKIE